MLQLDYTRGGEIVEELKTMTEFEELENVEELGDGWVAVGAVVGVGIVGVAVYLGVAT